MELFCNWASSSEKKIVKVFHTVLGSKKRPCTLSDMLFKDRHGKKEFESSNYFIKDHIRNIFEKLF